MHESSSRDIHPTFYVVFRDHDRGSKPGAMRRVGAASAERTADLMRQCGYQTVETRLAVLDRPFISEGRLRAFALIGRPAVSEPYREVCTG